MRIIIQRVKRASVEIDGALVNEIGMGLLVLVGIEIEDEHEDASYLAAKIINMRIFSDTEGKMNKSVLDMDGELLVVSQFTLHASTKKGNRPSFIKAARPEKAIPLYNSFVSDIERLASKKIKTGTFGADMQIHLVNDGPVTIFLDSKNKE